MKINSNDIIVSKIMLNIKTLLSVSTSQIMSDLVFDDKIEDLLVKYIVAIKEAIKTVPLWKEKEKEILEIINKYF